MNATQASHLLKSATRALALMNPDWIIAHQLRQAIDAARAPATRPVGKPSKRKGGMVYKPATAEERAVPHVWIEGKAVKCKCVACETHRFFMVGEHKQNMAQSANPFDKQAVISKLSTCACGHSPSAHAEDQIGNLLACEARNCECDHFHYSYEESEAA